jgi:hypothetical protein
MVQEYQIKTKSLTNFRNWRPISKMINFISEIVACLSSNFAHNVVTFVDYGTIKTKNFKTNIQ